MPNVQNSLTNAFNVSMGIKLLVTRDLECFMRTGDKYPESCRNLIVRCGYWWDTSDLIIAFPLALGKVLFHYALHAVCESCKMPPIHPIWLPNRRRLCS